MNEVLALSFTLLVITLALLVAEMRHGENTEHNDDDDEPRS